MSTAWPHVLRARDQDQIVEGGAAVAGQASATSACHLSRARRLRRWATEKQSWSDPCQSFCAETIEQDADITIDGLDAALLMQRAYRHPKTQA